LDPADGGISLVKVPGRQIAVTFSCPGCSELRKQDVTEPMVGVVTRVFRDAGRPLVFLPAQGDLPWPPLSADDLIEWGLHTDEILEHLTMGDSDG
jgi:hypothetical protein